ncbi:magnesium-protoporphyrin IX monomethyl ester (oxidative) cyclase [Nodosilinea sp. PGN35]|uniref:magnesium-protoporphyrin IX monomethyl ester (oxidative) cyclase n=1 Tax=Nodosilinea sp. PGN35 TaxID=3020489 RepID=UPI0023B28AF7|nr:magnesium-protoporphyrin IX monomethyl ester (oxidative) cyclase [Nodosilinea sp. TSF1-S3]MDF0368888.1 magnesium-protoporphyrin IX monomethyl ester (oxidative) cyclase [Nodosilinea sp. TSF1-S3]
MVDSLKKPELQELRPGVKAPAKDTILTPRFYTTDFDEMAAMDLSMNEEELLAILDELRADYNRHHFVRSEVFDQSWDCVTGETRRVFVEFLERSCTSEFSGFLLYKELSRRLKGKNPLLSECFDLISRDEARHAGFLNKAMADFNMQLDLGFLTKTKDYTFFKPKFILYATYLSEKIGYWRYITIFRHLETHPENEIYPIFRFFENWCQDENRHGDFFSALMKSQPQILNDWKARLWCRFFLLSVFATMYLNDLRARGFYESLGLNVREYDIEVIEKTNKTAGRVFPLTLNVEHPSFFKRLDVAAAANSKLSQIAESNQPKLVKKLQQLPHIATIGWQLVQLYFLKPIDSVVTRGQVY